MALKGLLITIMLLFGACGADPLQSHIIAKVPEASGICYDPASDSLFVANDEGAIYQLSRSGKILRKKQLGDYDLEGIACDTKNHRLLLAVEGVDNILIVDPKTLIPRKKININRKYRGKKLLIKDKEQGLEGITIAPDGTLYLSNQSGDTLPHNDPSVIILIKNIKASKTAIDAIIDPKKTDISGLAWQNGYLYMVSDTRDRLYRYNPKTGKIDRTYRLPHFAQEGVAFDNHTNIYFADDNGHVIQFDKKTLNID